MGKQVADNTELQLTTTIKEHEGKLYAITNREPKRGLVKSEYLPVGQSLVYPKKWGKKEGSLKFVRLLIDDQREVIKKAEDRINKLKVLEQELENLNI